MVFKKFKENTRRLFMVWYNMHDLFAASKMVNGSTPVQSLILLNLWVYFFVIHQVRSAFPKIYLRLECELNFAMSNLFQIFWCSLVDQNCLYLINIWPGINLLETLLIMVWNQKCYFFVFLDFLDPVPQFFKMTVLNVSEF